MILHTINKTTAITKCRAFIGDEDKIVLIEDGVYLALTHDLPFHALDADVEARGLTDKLADRTNLITYAEFVQLSTQADKICAWF